MPVPDRSCLGKMKPLTRVAFATVLHLHPPSAADSASRQDAPEACTELNPHDFCHQVDELYELINESDKTY